MGCDKRYGLREVWVAAEASPNTPATFDLNCYLQHCTGSTFPAVYRENMDNAEATGNRGQNTAFDGAQNELAWDVTVMLPSEGDMGDVQNLPNSLKALFWAAGFGDDTFDLSWTGELAGNLLDIKASSACGRTIQLIGLDRDKRQLELLTGAVVSQMVVTFNRNDLCTIQFSGVAAQKWEATAPTLTAADDGNTVFAAQVRGSFDASLPSSPARLTGVGLNLMGTSKDMISIQPSTGSIEIQSAYSATITASTPTTWDIAKPSTAYDVLSPDSWSVTGLDSVQSATITMETGNTYGELTTSAQYPSELLSGQVKVTASITAYLVDANIGALGFDSGAELKIWLRPNRTGNFFDIKKAKFSERPAIDLSSVDTPASGDFSLAAGETQSFITYNALDVLTVSA